MSAMTVVPRMNPSTASKARRAMASTVAAVWCGASDLRARSVRSESRRKKNMSRSARTAVAISSPTTLMPVSTPEAAVAPNLPSRLLAFFSRSSSEVPAAPKCEVTLVAICRRDATIWSPVSNSALTTMYPAPPTTATTATQVSAAATERFTLTATSRRWNGRSRAVPRRASRTGVTAVLKVTHNQIATAPTPATSSTTPHQAARRRTLSGSSTSPPDHGPHGVSPGPPPRE